MAKLLLVVDEIAVGNQDPDGVSFRIQLYPVSSDAAVRNAMETQDYFILDTDDGQTPLGYYDLLISETLAFMLSVHGITLAAADLVILGWNDFRFYGTSSYELWDDFLGGRSSGTGFIGRMGWEFADSWGWGPVNAPGTETEHPGFTTIRTSPSASSTSMWTLHQGRYHPNSTDELVTIVRPTVVTNVNYIAGLTTNHLSFTPTYGFFLYYDNSGTVWKVRLVHATGTTSYTSTMTMTANHWYRFRIARTGIDLPAATTTWNVTIDDITAGTTWTQAGAVFHTNAVSLMYPGYIVTNITAVSCHLDIDWFSIKLRDLMRTRTET